MIFSPRTVTQYRQPSSYSMSGRLDEIKDIGPWPDDANDRPKPDRFTWKPKSPDRFRQNPEFSYEEEPPYAAEKNSKESSVPGGFTVPIKHKAPSRFQVPGPKEKPTLSYLNQDQLDVILDRIKAEIAQPPHKRNEAVIADLKKQAQEIAKRLESQWVQKSADGLIPRLDEDQVSD